MARTSKAVKIGSITIGGGSKIAIQSMTNVATQDYEALKEQIILLQNAGCDIVRFTVPDKEAVKSIYRLKEDGITVPVVADIHFDYRLALESAAAGIDKIRINPGNIGADENVRVVAKACSERHIPIRIGVNSGSVEKGILAKHGGPTAGALAESAMYHASLLEKYDFTDIVISVKSSSVNTMIDANRILAEKCCYPLHLGVTEAGIASSGTVKSAIGIGALLHDGIGDTIRVSLTDNPVKEVAAAQQILRAMGMMNGGYYDVVSCPTCGRTKIDLIGLAAKVNEELSKLPKPDRKITVAVMGCVVNGPGEASEADVGIAGGNGEGIIFEKGKILKKVKEEEILSELLALVRNLR